MVRVDRWAHGYVLQVLAGVVLFPDPAGTQAPRYPRAAPIGTAKAGERDVTTFSASHIPATSGFAEDFAFRHSFVPL